MRVEGGNGIQDLPSSAGGCGGKHPTYTKGNWRSEARNGTSRTVAWWWKGRNVKLEKFRVLLSGG